MANVLAERESGRLVSRQLHSSERRERRWDVEAGIGTGMKKRVLI